MVSMKTLSVLVRTETHRNASVVKQKRISIHRIHKWRTRGKKLVPSHESEALEDKQKLQMNSMKTFSELAEC